MTAADVPNRPEVPNAHAAHAGPAPVLVGIDVCRSRLDVCLLPSGRTLSVDSDDDDGVSRVVALLKQHQPVARVLVEATGRHERRCAAALLDGRRATSPGRWAGSRRPTGSTP